MESEVHVPDIPGKIVFSKEVVETGDRQIFTMNADGSAIRQLTDAPGGANAPTWSPDGNLILYSSSKMGTSHNPAFWTMNANGNNKGPLYLRENREIVLRGRNARWSPMESRIAYQSYSHWIGTEIFVYDLEKDVVIRMTDNVLIDEGGLSWSPDGTHISFGRASYYNSEEPEGIHIQALGDTVATRITKSSSRVGAPIWGPEGNSIFFKSNDAFYGITGIYKMDLQSGDVELLIEDPWIEDANSPPIRKYQYLPLALSPGGEYLLVTSAGTSDGKKEPNKLYVYHLENDEFREIFVGPSPDADDYGNHSSIQADWHISN